MDDHEFPLSGVTELSEEERAVIDAFRMSALQRPTLPLAAGASVDRPLAQGDDLTFLDEIPPELRELFRHEAAEDIQALRYCLLHMEHQPEEPAYLREMGLVAHKLKGSAAQYELTTLASVTLKLEDALKALHRGQVPLSSRAAATLSQFLDLLDVALVLPDAGSDREALDERAAYLRGVLLGEAAARSQQAASSALAVASSDADTLPWLPQISGGESPLKLDAHELDELVTQIHALVLTRATLRLARDEALSAQQEMGTAITRLQRLHAQLLELHPLATLSLETRLASWGLSAQEGNRAGPAEAGGSRGAGVSVTGTPGMPSGLDPRAVQGGEAQPPERIAEQDTERDQILRALSETVADVATTSAQLHTAFDRLIQAGAGQGVVAEDLQREIARIRLVPLADLVPYLQFEIRRLERSLGKRVNLRISGEMTPIDRNICSGLREPLTQLIRNAVVHGLETPDERAELGKPAEGTVWLHASHVGGDVILELGDDGRGINPQQLIAAALTDGILTPEAARALDDVQAQELMFEPGVTTIQEPQLVGGRGIGLDEVRSLIRRLRGTLRAQSDAGKGTVFHIQVPISLSTLRALHVVAGNQLYAVPFHAVSRTLLLDTQGILTESSPTRDGPAVHAHRHALIPSLLGASAAGSPLPGAPDMSDDAQAEMLPVFTLGELLGFDQPLRERTYALVVATEVGRAVLLADDLVEDRDILVQALPWHLQRRILRGTTVTPRGELALVVDLVDLVTGALSGARSQPAPAPRRQPLALDAPTLAPRVLVVDDSEAIRRTLEFQLSRAGFTVDLARDGIEALEVMLARPPRVVLLDAEMPRLDGFELLSVLQHGEQFQHVRVAMLTSRGSEKHRERALQLGAAAYLIKPCRHDTLVATIQDLLTEPIGTL